jgi:TPR repeat protein
MCSLGSIYYDGGGRVETDKNKAFLLYSYSDARPAWGELGVFYARGEIVEKDYEKALMLFAKYALTRDIERFRSFFNLAKIYREGIHVEVDERFADYCKEKGQKLEEAFEAKYKEMKRR